MNKLFLTAITGECCLMALNGLEPRGYNPFTLARQQLAKEGITFPNNQRLPVLLQLQHIYKDNDLKEHPLLQRTIDKLSPQPAAV